MGQKKLVRFAAIETYPNVLQYPEDMAGKWKDFFGNAQPITLELACGKGEYSVGLGRQHRDRNFIGMDVKGNRIYVGAKTALKEDLKNVAFVRTQIGKLPDYFTPGEVEEIWIIFPDPFLRASRAKNRLTHPRFLSLYQRVLRPGGTVHLKTDSRELYDFSREMLGEYGCEVVEDIQDIHGKGLTTTGPLSIRTHYEGLHLADGRTIYYLSFRLPATPIIPPKRKAKEAADSEDGQAA